MRGIGAGTVGGVATFLRAPAPLALRGRFLRALEREAGQRRLFP
jgi:hypothetical protein